MSRDDAAQPPGSEDTFVDAHREAAERRARLHREALDAEADLHRRYLALQRRTAGLIARALEVQANEVSVSAPEADATTAEEHVSESKPAAAPARATATIDIEALRASSAALQAVARDTSPDPPETPSSVAAPAPTAESADEEPEERATPSRPRERRNTTAFTNPIVAVKPPVPTVPRGHALPALQLEPQPPEGPGSDTHEALLHTLAPPTSRRPVFKRIAGLWRQEESGSASIWGDVEVDVDAEWVVSSRLGVDLLTQAMDLRPGLEGLMGVEPGEGLSAGRLTAHSPTPRATETVRIEAHLKAEAEPRRRFESCAFVDDRPTLSWRSATAPSHLPEPGAPLDDTPWRPPRCADVRRLSPRDLTLLTEGDAVSVLGTGFSPMHSHRNPPSLPKGPFLLIQEVLDVDAGSAERPSGFMRSRIDATRSPLDMLAAGIQSATLFLIWCGYAIARDGWSFELTPYRPIEVAWDGREPVGDSLALELAVRDHGDLPIPALVADLVVSDGQGPLMVASGLTLQLAPDWPASATRPLSQAPQADEGVPFSRLHLADCGRPSEAFGPLYADFDGPRYLPRPPGGRLLMASRVLSHRGTPGRLEDGDRLTVEVDLRPDAWLFEGGEGEIPIGVLLELASWPCRYLALVGGVPLWSEHDLYARILEGSLSWHGPIPTLGTLKTTAVVRNLSQRIDQVVLDFDVTVFDPEDGERLLTLEVAIGFFRREALQRRTTLAGGAFVSDPGPPDDTPDLDALAERARLPTGPLRAIDTLQGIWSSGGRAHLGLARARYHLRPDAWYFRDHTYQDPVVPTSLFVESALQLLRLSVAWLEPGGLTPDTAHVEAQAQSEPLTWRGRGQLTPTDPHFDVEVEITEVVDAEDHQLVRATARVISGPRQVMQVERLALRLVPLDDEAEAPPPPDVLDPAHHRWLQDYRPTWTVPALPLTVAADILANAARQTRPEHVVFKLERLVMTRWTPLRGPTRFSTRADLARARRSALITSLSVRDASRQGEGGWEEIATGRVVMAPSFGPCHTELEPLENPEPVEPPYASGELFHGPSFHLLQSGEVGDNGARGVLNPSGAKVPTGLFHPALLEAALHLVTSDALCRWSEEVDRAMAVFPTKIEVATFHGPPPTEGTVEAEVRFDGFRAGPRFPAVRVHLLHEGEIWATVRLVLVLVARGRLGELTPEVRRRFVEERQFVPEVGLSTFEGGTSHLRMADVQVADWLEGTVASLYHAEGDLEEMSREVVVKDLLAQHLQVHPSEVAVSSASGFATCLSRPLACYPFKTRREMMGFRAELTRSPYLDPSPGLHRMRTHHELPAGWLGEDLVRGLLRFGLSEIVLSNVGAAATLRGLPALYVLATPWEPGLLMAQAALKGFAGVDPVVADPTPSWLQETLDALGAFPEGDGLRWRMSQPLSAESLQASVERQQPVLVHLGSLDTAHSAVLATLLGYADAASAPVVPLRIPAGSGESELLECGRPVDLIVGDVLSPGSERRRADHLLRLLHRLGRGRPTPEARGEVDLSAESRAWSESRGVSACEAWLFKILQHTPSHGEDAHRLVDASGTGQLHTDQRAARDAWLTGWVKRLSGSAVEVVES